MSNPNRFRDLESLRSEVVQVLRTKTRNVNFAIPTTQIWQGFFQVVANHLEGNIPIGRRIQVIVNVGVRANSRGAIYSGIDAEYSSRQNAFIFSDSHIAGNIVLEALTIHEAVHAGLDIIQARRVTAIDEEAYAYVAQCLYLLDNGITSGSGSSPTFNTAYAAANAIKNTGILTTQLLEPLRNALRSNPNYSQIIAPDLEYLHNGV